jgi:4-amino-4-deoxy-L-arabinose transferase-like glycosyltransferase
MSVLARSRPLPASSKLHTGSSPFLTVRLLRAIAQFAETHGWLLFVAISLGCGWGRMSALASRHLDHDELFTFYIAQAPTLGRLIKLTHSIDLHPPLSYLLVRLSFAVFGISAWSCRLPFLLAFLGTGVVLYFFLSRILSPIYGLIATLLLWSNPFAYLANEARPYSMLLFFTALMLLSWYRVIEWDGLSSDRWALIMVTASGFGLLLSHVFGVLVYAAFVASELLRLAIRRKPDWRLWSALLVPTISVLTYLPLFRTHSTMLFADEYRVTPLRLAGFYWESIRYVVTPLAVIALLALLWPVFRKQARVTPPATTGAVRASLGLLLAGLALVPIVSGILLARDGTAFFDRYGVVWLVPFTVVPALVLGFRTQQDRLAATATALLLVAIFFFDTSGKAWLIEQASNLLPSKVAAKLLYVFVLPPIISVQYPQTPSYLRAAFATAPLISDLASVDPDLPLVANTGLTFMELDRQETAQVTKRLYMLTDDEAASTIAHDTVFAHYEQVKEAFSLRGTIQPFCTFISEHPRFVVVGAYNNPQGWLLRKLDRDGAELRVIGTCGGNTEDCRIYEITVRREQCQKSSELSKTIVK